MPILSPRHRTVVRLAVSVGLALATIWLSLLWVGGTPVSSNLRFVGYGLFFVAFVVLFLRRANELSPAFWILLLLTYPVLAPILSLDVFGTELFASGAADHQNLTDVTPPMLLAAMMNLFVALNISVQPITMPKALFSPATPLQPRALVWSAFGASLALLFLANWMDAQFHTLNLGQLRYREIINMRDKRFDFAASLLLVFAVTTLLGACMLLRDRRVSNQSKTWVRWGVAITFLVIAVWQVLSGSRIEAIGMFFLCLLFFGDRVNRWVRFGAVGAIVGAFAFIGYFRNLLSVEDYLARNFVSWPGGVENLFNTYAFGLNAIKDGTLPVMWGTSYTDLIQRLPPKVFGLDRPERAIDILSDLTHLKGGMYVLTEPFLNFLGFGMAGFALLMVMVFNIAIRRIQCFWQNPSRVFGAVVCTTVMICVFRLLWYPFEHTVKTVLASAIVALLFLGLGLALPVRSPAAHKA